MVHKLNVLLCIVIIIACINSVLTYFAPKDRVIIPGEWGWECAECPKIYAPVCAYDNRTYINECKLHCYNGRLPFEKRVYFRHYGPCVLIRRSDSGQHILVLLNKNDTSPVLMTDLDLLTENITLTKEEKLELDEIADDYAAIDDNETIHAVNMTQSNGKGWTINRNPKFDLIKPYYMAFVGKMRAFQENGTNYIDNVTEFDGNLRSIAESLPDFHGSKISFGEEIGAYDGLNSDGKGIEFDSTDPELENIAFGGKVGVLRINPRRFDNDVLELHRIKKRSVQENSSEYEGSVIAFGGKMWAFEENSTEFAGKFRANEKNLSDIDSSAIAFGGKVGAFEDKTMKYDDNAAFDGKIRALEGNTSTFDDSVITFGGKIGVLDTRKFDGNSTEPDNDSTVIMKFMDGNSTVTIM